MPMVLFFQVLLGVIFSPALIKSLNAAMGMMGGTDLNGMTSTDVERGIADLLARQAAPPTTPGAQPEETRSPTTGEIVQTMAQKPANWFGLALLVGGSVFLVSQLRAAGHEAGSAAVDLYKEGKGVGTSLKNADGTTGNISRRAKT